VTEAVRIDLVDRIAHLVLDAPPRNELDVACLAELARLVREELPRLDPRGLVVSGAGRHFSSGASVPQLEAIFRSDPAGGARLVEEHGAALTAIERLRVPTVAAIAGTCLGAALELALACRFRVASRRATLALPEASFGLMPGLGGIARLTTLLGRSRAVELVLSGRSVGAEEALALGLVDAIAERGALLETARSLVRLAGRPGFEAAAR
jgi:enoyl-CoA hydratase/carnithine racemase